MAFAKNRSSPTDVDALLGRKDYLAYWRGTAHSHAEQYGWRGNVDELATVLKSTLRKEWLDEEAHQLSRRMGEREAIRDVLDHPD
jgi:hypothetical protein